MEKESFLNELTPKPYLVPDDKDYDFPKRYESLIEIAKTICPSFELTDENKAIYENGIKYFAADETCTWSLKKSLYLFGRVGVWKTLFFKIFRALNLGTYSHNNFNVLNVNNLVEGFAKAGYEYFSTVGFTGHGNSGRGNPVYGFQMPAHLLLDDLGQSAKSTSHFGSNTNVLNEFIQRRYIHYTDSFRLTHISSNLDPSNIKKEYGEFVASRLREMCNIIVFPGQDKRK